LPSSSLHPHSENCKATKLLDILKVNCSPTAKSLPIHAGMRRGIFKRHGIDLRLVSNENSKAQREGLKSGAFQIVHVAVDNAIAMRETDGIDIVVFMGGDSGMNELFVQPHVGSVEDIRGGRLVVDAPDTAFALQAYKILEDHGLRQNLDYEIVVVGRGAFRLAAMQADSANTAAILNPPYSLEARNLGLRTLGDTTDFIGPYQAGSAFAMRAWAEENRNLVIRYVRAYLECLAWSLDPANDVACVAILVEEINAAPDVARQCMELLRQPGFGLDPSARISTAAMQNTLALRSILGGIPLNDPTRYVDLSYWEAAVTGPAAAI
jgi:ABC-type nitrate/sulfonate/bicarbonate transport system substrate-binding protein